MPRSDVAAWNANLIMYSTVNAAALEQVNAALKADPGIDPPAAIRARLRPMLARTPEQTRAETRVGTCFRTAL